MKLIVFVAGKFIEVSCPQPQHLKVFINCFDEIAMIQDVTKRVNIKYFNSFDRMESCLRNHVQSMPTIINSELVQVIIMLFITD